MQHPFAFDPSYGYSEEALRAIQPPPEPADFDAFWRETYAATMAHPLGLDVEERESASEEHRLRVLRFQTLDGVRVGAWLVEPRDRPVAVGAIVGHGYAPRLSPEYPRRAAAFLFVCAPGFSLSADPGIPDGYERHVVHGIARRDTYILRHCVAALWSAARALEDLVPATRGRMLYSGESFGGGLGALALPWEPRYRRGHLVVPTFGHHPLRLTMPCVGSGECVRRHVQDHPAAREVLAYFDAASAARRIRIPMLAVPARFDPAVPPPGQFAVCNALAGPTELLALTAGHFNHPGAVAENAMHARCAERVLWPDAPAWA
ncbi:MAG: acetylxylan esterase [Lentisphaerae bacterium]|nr:acetylxylan esterase [Lentisphaerota bacterium]